MNNGKTHLLIGGPCDGRRMTMLYPNEMIKSPLPIEGILDFARINDISPIAPTPITTTYYAEKLRGHEFEITFYRHESLSLDQAIDRLFARYPTETTHPG